MKISGVLRLPLKPGQKVVGLEKLMEQGVVDSYQRTPQGITALSRHPDAQSQLAALPVEGGPATGSLSRRVKDFILPTDVKGKCAPEYLRHRAWATAASAISSVLGFMMTTVHLDSIKASFSTSEKAAMAGVITGSLGKTTQMLGYSLAKRGDSDPKSSYLLASTISSVNCIAGLGILAALPGANLAVTAATALTGTLGSVIGSAAGVNIFNHLASGPNKGEVAAKNGNQDLLVGCLGMPGGLLMSALARGLGMNPAILAACSLGPALLYCSARAATALRMNAVDQVEMKELLRDYNGTLKEAPDQGLWASFKDVRAGARPWLKCSDRLEDFAAEIDYFRGRRYLLTEKDGQMLVALSKDATAEDAIRALAHAARLEGTPGGLLEGRLRDSEPGELPTVERFREAGWNVNLAHLGLRTLDASW